MSRPDGDDDVSVILSNMFTKSQMHKENDDQVHDDVDTDATRANDGGRDNHDQTLLVCATKIKEYKLTTSNNRYARIKDNFYVEKVAPIKSRNSMIFADEDESIHDSIPFFEPSYLL